MACGMIAAALFVARADARRSVFIVAAATLIFLFVAVRNSWDAITYHVVAKGTEQRRGRL